LEIYPRYSTTLFLSLTATDKPGLARHNVALEPSSNSILNSDRVRTRNGQYPLTEYDIPLYRFDLGGRTLG
jgi:hypothetical protein